MPNVYVNLDPADATALPQPEDVAGPRVTVVATRTKAAGKAGGLRHAAFEATPLGSNLAAPVPVFVNAGPVDETNAAPGQYQFTNRIDLPQVGGNQYTISAKKKHQNSSGSGAATVTAPQLQVWRRVYYRLHAPPVYAALAAGLEAKLNELFAGAFINMKESTGCALPVAYGTAGCTGDDFTAHVAAQADVLTHPGFEIRVGIVARYLDSTMTSTVTLGAAAVTFGPGGTWTKEIELDKPDNVFGGPVTPRVKVLTARAQEEYVENCTAAPIAGKERSFLLTINQVDWDAAVGALPTKHFKTEISYSSYKQFTGMTLGGPTILLAVERMKERFGIDPVTLDGFARVLAHELCHALGGATKTVSAVDHPRFYPSDKGGTAGDGMGHCGGPSGSSTRVVENQNAGAFRDPTRPGVSTMTTPNGNAQTCIMYHQGWSRLATASFCPDCIKHLRLFDLTQAGLAAGTGRAPGFPRWV